MYRMWGVMAGVAVLPAAYVAASVAAERYCELRESVLAESGQAIEESRYDTAVRLSDQWLSREPDSSRALLLAALARYRSSRHAEALELLAQVADADSVFALTARRMAGEICFHGTYDMRQAESELRNALRCNPHDVRALDLLSTLLHRSGRDWEATPLVLELIRQGVVSFDIMLRINRGLRLHINAEFLAHCVAAHAESPVVLTGLANNAQLGQKWDDAKGFLERAIAGDAALIEAQVRLGAVLNAAAYDEEYEQWARQLPESTSKHPDLWVVQGNWASKRKQPAIAARCYWEALQRDPNQMEACTRLATELASLGDLAGASQARVRAETLGEYANAVIDTYALIDTPNHEDRVLRCSRLAEDLGLLWEAYGWVRLLARDSAASSAVAERQNRLWSQLRDRPLARSYSGNPISRFDVQRYPIPSAWARAASQPEPVATPAPAGVFFADEAAEVGLRFSYFKGQDRDGHGSDKVYWLTGGGVGIIDFDADGRPDIYLTQGTTDPQSREALHIDRVFRNLASNQFVDVTEETQIFEDHYSQGVAVGDIDNDGFQDLVVANIGRDRLFRNNGDGTFSESPLPDSEDEIDWTTSCAIADMTGDGAPDIYLVNYLAGPDVLSRRCGDPGAAAISTCHPRSFPAAQDRFLVGSSGGVFHDVTHAAGIAVPEGRGLGIVVADFRGVGRNDIFIANDAVPNFYFVNQNASASGSFEEQALVRGVAVSGTGLAQACMGVACGDMDDNGKLDMLITNFYHESSTLYLQEGDGVYRDSTSSAGVGAPSYSMLGFGTQCIDGDLDGDHDVIVTNGAVDVITNPDGSYVYEMRPQYFDNTGGARFQERAPEELGPFFAGKYLGRGLARLDWNRDGLEDVAISHLDAPVALLTNRSRLSAHRLVVRLVGAVSPREPIGATVRIRIGEQSMMRQLTAGDGYQASNERALVFGTGSADRIDEMEIRWPSGLKQTFYTVDSDLEVICVEGRDKLHVAGHYFAAH